MASLLILDRFSGPFVASFRERKPFPWAAIEGLLSPDAFDTLGREFPPLSLFERHVGLHRRFGQRPHDRFYLELETSLYHANDAAAPGVIRLGELSPAWRRLLEELGSEPYRGTVLRLLGARSARLRFTWHIGVMDSEVSPHRDAREKLGTHLFYFNTALDWSAAWGGATVLLGGRKTFAMNPGFEDFETATDVPFLGNRSLLFLNGRSAWHGMKRLTAPPGVHRRLFNVIFDRPGKRLPRLLDSAEAVAWRLARPLAALGGSFGRKPS
jgi:hypothetical protein